MQGVRGLRWCKRWNNLHTPMRSAHEFLAMRRSLRMRTRYLHRQSRMLILTMALFPRMDARRHGWGGICDERCLRNETMHAKGLQTSTSRKPGSMVKLQQGRSRKSGSNLVLHVIFYVCSFVEVRRLFVPVINDKDISIQVTAAKNKA